MENAYFIASSLLTNQKRATTEDPYASEDDSFDGQQPLNNIHTQHVVGEASLATVQRKRVNGQKFTVIDLPPRLKRKWLDIYDTYVVDMFFARKAMNGTEQDRMIDSIWRSEFKEDVEAGVIRPTTAQKAAVISFITIRFNSLRSNSECIIISVKCENIL